MQASAQVGRAVSSLLFSGKLKLAGLLVLAGFLMAPPAPAASRAPLPQLVLVEEGVALAPVVIFEHAPPLTRRAADELAEYIEKTSGARPEVIEGRPDPLPERAIWVGYQPVLDELLPGVDLEFRHPEEILIVATTNHLVVAGRDRWNPEHLSVEFPGPSRRTRVVDGVQMEYGTCNAVYTFLQDYLDVRWIWPGETGEDILPRTTIAFAPFEYRYHPRMRGRANIFTFSSLSSWRGHSHDWLRFQRGQLDSIQVSGGHPFAGWWDRFHETNPDFFALQPDGSRRWTSGRTTKICKSNPAVWAQWLKDVEAELERNPNKQVFSAAANDGGYSGYCVCDNCLAWDHPDGQVVRYTWQGLSQEYVAVSDRQVTFANTLARMLKERFPGRDLYVSGMSYGNSRPVPVAAVPDDNVIFAIVANFLNRPSAHPLGDSRELFMQWGQIAPHLAWRPNLGGDAGWREGLPNVAPRRVIADMRTAGENNTIAMFCDMVWEHWANHAPHYYMLAQMAWNPFADGEAILADYYQRAFGPAVKPMTAYWDMLEQAAGAIVFEGRSQAEAWNDDFYRRAYAYLDQAGKTVAGAPEVYRQRIDFVRAGMDYLRLYRANRALIQRMRSGREPDPADLETARANWQKIVRIFEDYPLAFNPLYVSPTRARGLVANPDHKD